MKILSVVPDLTSGGVQKSARNFILEYISEGHNNCILLHEMGGEYFEELQDSSADIVSIKDGIQYAEKFDPDLVHIHSHSIDDDVIQSIYERTNATFIEHNIWDEPSTYQNVLDVSCLMSGFGLWRYKTHTDTDGKVDTAIVHNPISVDDFYPSNEEKIIEFKKKYGIPESGFILGRIGQNNDEKWSPLILSAFYELAKENSDVYLILRGFPENAKSTLEIFPDRIQSRIILLPYLEDDELRHCYSSIDIFVHTAKQGETFGNVLVESMLCETPVVTLSTPYNDNAQVEVVSHRVGGLVAASAYRFICLVKALYESSELREKLGSSGRERAHKLYNSSSAAKKVLDLSNGIYDGENITSTEIISLLDSIEGGLNRPQKFALRVREYYEKYIRTVQPTDHKSWRYIIGLASIRRYQVHLKDWKDITTVSDIHIPIEY